MPSPPLINSPEHSPNSMSPRSLSPNPQHSPKHNVRPSSMNSSCYQSHIPPAACKGIIDVGFMELDRQRVYHRLYIILMIMIMKKGFAFDLV